MNDEIVEELKQQKICCDSNIQEILIPVLSDNFTFRYFSLNPKLVKAVIDNGFIQPTEGKWNFVKRVDNTEI